MKDFPTEGEVKELEIELEAYSCEDLLRWSVDRFGEKMFMTSGFGPNSICIIHMLRDIYPDLPIYFIDTTYLFKETLALRDHYLSMGVNIQVLRPDLSESELEENRRNRLYEKDPEECCRVHKVSVFQQALKAEHCWIAPLRKSSSKTRANIKAIESLPNGVIRVCPLRDWTLDHIWEYIKKHNLKYNPLHDQNYLSIGCEKCTRPVVEGADERDGRWSGQKKTECGLHTFFSKGKEEDDLREKRI